MSIKLYENFRSVMYAPFYLAVALDAYDKEGVELEMLTSPNLPETTAGLLAGKVDVSWGGPLRILLDYDKNQNSPLVAFCEVNTRDPFFLVGRSANPNFEFSNLLNLKFATIFEAPTPWICLQDDIRNAGIDPEKLSRIKDSTVEENIKEFKAGNIDVVQLFEPFVEQLIQEGTGHIWYSSATRGYTAYTSFFAKRETIIKKKNEILKMTRAIYRTQRWLFSHNSNEIATLISPFFPDIHHKILSGAIARYKELGIWSRDPMPNKEGFERLKGAMISYGIISSDTAYEDCIDSSFSEQTISDDPPEI